MRISIAILEHNIENFSLDILEYCLPKDVIKREQHYLDIYKLIYNTLKIAGSSLSFKKRGSITLRYKWHYYRILHKIW